MPTMKATRTMRAEPNGASIGVIADLGMKVKVLEAKDGFTKIELLDDVAKPKGWVSTDAIEMSEAPVSPIDKNAFARACWRQALFFEVNAHYLAAAAELRTRISSGSQDGKMGPYLFTAQEWDSNRKSSDDKFKFELDASDISDWRAQCIVFGSMVEAAQRALMAKNGNKAPTVLELYIAQTFAAGAPTGDELQKLKDGLKAAIDSTRQLIIEAGGEVLDAPPTKDALQDANTQTGSTQTLIGTLFTDKAPGIMKQLMADFGFNKVQAAGVLGNIGHECAGFKLMQEVNPVGGGRGGLGMCQWTGPRRVKFENFCQEQGLQTDSEKANYGFLRLELNTSEKAAVPAVLGAATLGAAVRAFELSFERAGIKHYESRDKWAKRALDAFEAKPPQ